MIDLGPLDDDAEPEALDLRAEIATGNAAAAQWWLEPTAGLWPDLAEALRIDAVDLDATEPAPDRVQLSWALTVRILDADAVRALAYGTCVDPTHQAEIDRSFAVAWNHAADPWAPLADMPGVSWTPVSIEVAHGRARPAE